MKRGGEEENEKNRDGEGVSKSRRNKRERTNARMTRDQKGQIIFKLSKLEKKGKHKKKNKKKNEP